MQPTNARHIPCLYIYLITLQIVIQLVGAIHLARVFKWQI